LLLAITSLVCIHWLNPERGVVLAGLFLCTGGNNMTIREIVTDLLDNSPETVFSLWWLADTVGLRRGERTMPHTVREACRDYADRAGAEFYCVDRKRSQYKYVPGVKIAGALEGKE